MQMYDVAVIGAGPLGIMAALRVAQLKKHVVLVERNNSTARKLLLTGSGRCNLTNTSSPEAFIEKFGSEGQFLRTAFSVFSSEDLMDFFSSNGLKLKTERQGRVFPVTDEASSVVRVLERCLSGSKVTVICQKIRQKILEYI